MLSDSAQTELIHDRELCVSEQELASYLLMTPRHIRNLMGSSILERTSRGYPLKVNVQRFIRAKLSSPKQVNEHRQRLLKSKADMAELNVQQKAGELVKVTDIEKQWFRIGREVRDSLEAIPSRVAGLLAAECDQTKCFEILAKEIRQSLEVIANGNYC